MTDLERERESDETAGDILARKLSALRIDTPPKPTTFAARVGISAALESLPGLEAIGSSSGRTSYGTFGKKAEARVPEPKATHFGAIDADAGLDRVADIANRLEKTRQKRLVSQVTSADIAEEKARQQSLVDLINRSEGTAAPREENFGGLSDATMAAVRKKAQESAAAKERFEMEGRKKLSSESYGGIMDIFTKKGRAKMKKKKDLVNQSVHLTKAKIIEDRLAEKEAKKETMKAKPMPALRKSGSFSDWKSRAMEPSERIAYETAEVEKKKRSLPDLVDLETFAHKSGRREHVIAPDERARKERERKNNMERFMVALRPPERALVEHMNELVRHSPGVGLQAVESSFNQLAPTRANDSNYLGALAFGSMLTKIRSDIEQKAPIKGAELKRTADGYHAQASTPMDASKARLFAEALDQYGVFVRKSATELSSDDRIQEETAMHLGENVADALIASVPLASDASWNANHPKIALAAVTDRLFQSVLKSAVNDAGFVSTRMNSFWAAEMPQGKWKAVAQKHFV